MNNGTTNAANTNEPTNTTEATADYGLETVFSVGHEYHSRIFYDRAAGEYYDRGTDLYLTLAEAASFGIK